MRNYKQGLHLRSTKWHTLVARREEASALSQSISPSDSSSGTPKVAAASSNAFKDIVSHLCLTVTHKLPAAYRMYLAGSPRICEQAHDAPPQGKL